MCFEGLNAGAHYCIELQLLGATKVADLLIELFHAAKAKAGIDIQTPLEAMVRNMLLFAWSFGSPPTEYKWTNDISSALHVRRACA